MLNDLDWVNVCWCCQLSLYDVRKHTPCVAYAYPDELDNPECFTSSINYLSSTAGYAVENDSVAEKGEPALNANSKWQCPSH